MAQPGWHGGRGGSRGRRSAWSGRGSRVWTPGSASALRTAAPTTAPAPAPAAAAATAAVAPAPTSSPTTPALKARTSTRKAADLVQVVSEQTAAEIDVHLKEVEDRLAVVIAQEEEVRAIADDHLEREGYLTKLLQDLYRQQKEEQEGPSRRAASPLASSARPLLEVPEAASASGDDQRAAAAPSAPAPAPAQTTAAAASIAGPTVQDAVSQSLPPPDPAPSLPQPARKVSAPASAAGPPASAQTGSSGSAQARRRHASSGTPRASSSAVAAATGGKDPDPSLVLAMAMGCSLMPGGDDLLTRDAVTIAEYIGLMSYEAVAAEDPGAGFAAERWQQPGLSLKDTLDRAEATAACPARMPNLLALAEAIRPLNGKVFAGAAAAAGLPSSGGSNNHSKKRKGGAGIWPGVSGFASRFPPLDTTLVTADTQASATEAPTVPPWKTATATADGQARETEATVPKKMRVDVSAILCPFELNGVCNDDDCRYQHLDIYLRKPSEKRIAPPPPVAAAAATKTAGLPAFPSNPSAPGKGPARSPATKLSAAGTSSDETALESKQPIQHQLPAIDFSGECEPSRQAEPGGDRGGGREGANPPPKPSERQAVSPAERPTGDGGEDATMEGEDSGEETTSVDGEEDFLALPTESGESGSGTTEGEASEAAGAAEKPSPSELADAFARAASGDSTKGGHGRGGGGGATGVRSNSSGGLEARYYFEDGGRKAQGAAVTALTEDQLNALEAQLNEDAHCDVEGWLLLALHRLPRAGDSATAVLNAVGGIARGASGPVGSVDQATIKTALRTFVQPLERAEGGQAEALWLLYLRLFAFLPGKGGDALGMAEYALEKFPTSRRIWRLYHSMLQKSSGWSLPKEISCYTRQIEVLLLLRSRAADAAAMHPKPQRGSGNSSSTGAEESEPGPAESGDGGGGGGKHANVEMVIYLVLERCCLLAESGNKLQAAAETLDALGALTEGQPLWRWDAPHEQGKRTVLRTPAGGDSSGGGGGSLGVPNGASAAGDGQRLPPGVATAVNEAPRESRCLLWLTALHLLMTGVFPRHALLLAEHGGGGSGGGGGDGGAETDPRGDTRDLAHLLLWPKGWLTSKSSSGLKPPVNAELQEVIFKTFMNALSDAELLPPKSRGGQGWAPPTKDRDALLSSAVEAKTARTRGLAPDPSALEGTPLVLALNWLTFCRRRADAKQGRMMAVACCRRFQLARPDHPALLEHFLLEHQISKARTLDNIYDEISRAFDSEGVAAEALRERREAAEGTTAPNPAVTDSDQNEPSVLPSDERLQAVYSFLRFVEMRLEAAGSNSATPARRDTVEVARRLLHKALVGMWTAAPASASNAGSSDPGWPQGEYDEPVRQALEGAKASLFRWADGGGGSEAEISAGASSTLPDVRGRRRRDVPGRNGERQLSTIVFSLWVLGGASAAIGALDHLLSAESFSRMSAERRRLAWLQRLRAAVVLSTQRVQAPEKDSLQAVRKVALRALADHRTHRRAEYPTLAHFVASTLDRPVVDGSSSREFLTNRPGRYDPASVAAETPVASFSFDVLTVYANHFRRVRGGVDWVVAAEALERGGGGGEDGRSAALALLRWVSWAEEEEHLATWEDRKQAGKFSLGILTNARPYVDKALTRHPGDPELSGAVAALAAATRWPGLAQRVLEAALRANPYCAALWQQRVALEAGFGCGSMERACATAAAAASSNAFVRLSCGGKMGEQSPSALQARKAGQIATLISHPSARRDTKSFSLQAALTGPAPEAAAAPPTVVVPRSVFLMKSLVNLSLAFNGLVSVPVAIGRLSALRSLDVSGNALTTLPLSLSRLSGTLRVLRAAGNKLKSPLSGGAVEDLVSLRVLDLEHNELSEFPEAVVRRLTELRTLKLAGNVFCERAPTGLSDILPHLEELTLP